MGDLAKSNQIHKIEQRLAPVVEYVRSLRILVFSLRYNFSMVARCDSNGLTAQGNVNGDFSCVDQATIET